MSDDIYVIDTGTTWFGPYASKEDAEEALYNLRKRGDSLGVKLTGYAAIKPARYTSGGPGIEWDKSKAHKERHKRFW